MYFFFSGKFKDNYTVTHYIAEFVWRLGKAYEYRNMSLIALYAFLVFPIADIVFYTFWHFIRFVSHSSYYAKKKRLGLFKP